MSWFGGCILARGVEDVIKIDEIMEKKYLIGIFQHDNDSKHTANTIKAYLEGKTHSETLPSIEWPPQSLNLNITEAVWQPALQEAWRTIIEVYLQTL